MNRMLDFDGIYSNQTRSTTQVGAVEEEQDSVEVADDDDDEKEVVNRSRTCELSTIPEHPIILTPSEAGEEEDVGKC